METIQIYPPPLAHFVRNSLPRCTPQCKPLPIGETIRWGPYKYILPLLLTLFAIHCLASLPNAIWITIQLSIQLYMPPPLALFDRNSLPHSLRSFPNAFRKTYSAQAAAIKWRQQLLFMGMQTHLVSEYFFNI